MLMHEDRARIWAEPQSALLYVPRVVVLSEGPRAVDMSEDGAAHRLIAEACALGVHVEIEAQPNR